MLITTRCIGFVIPPDRYVGTQNHGIVPKLMLKRMRNTSKQFLMQAGESESQLDLM